MFITAHTAVQANGLFDLANDTAGTATGTTVTVGGAAAVIFIFIRAWSARGALAAVIVAAFSAAIFMWLLKNVGSVEDRVGNDLNGLRPTTTQSSAEHLRAATFSSNQGDGEPSAPDVRVSG